MSTQEAGLRSEQKAMDYLTSQGLRCIMRNYRCRLGEIDLIMRDQDYLVFIEVRARTSQGFGGGVASINLAKQQKLLKTASHYLLINKLQDKQPVRFDVVSLDGPLNSCKVTWLKNAITADW